MSPQAGVAREVSFELSCGCPRGGSQEKVHQAGGLHLESVRGGEWLDQRGGGQRKPGRRAGSEGFTLRALGARVGRDMIGISM